MIDVKYVPILYNQPSPESPPNSFTCDYGYQLRTSSVSSLYLPHVKHLSQQWFNWLVAFHHSFPQQVFDWTLCKASSRLEANIKSRLNPGKQKFLSTSNDMCQFGIVWKNRGWFMCIIAPRNDVISWRYSISTPIFQTFGNWRCIRSRTRLPRNIA